MPKFFLLCCLVIAGCGGGGGSRGTGNPAPQPPDETPRGPLIISGKITYERVFFDDTGSGLDYSTRQNFPAREIIVELVDSMGLVQASSQTDAQGNYSFTLDEAGAYRIVANAKLAITDTRVTDNTSGNSLYQLQGSLANSGTTNSIRNLNASIGWGSDAFITDRAAAPFAILDTVYAGIEKLEQETGGIFTADSLPDTELRWSVNNRPTVGDRTDEDLEAGDIGSSFYRSDLGVIYLLGEANNDTDEFDQHVVLHEWMHYLVDSLSRSDSIGGSHSLGDKLDFRLAWGEGIATGFAAILLDDAEYRDASGSNQQSEFYFSVESPASSSIGWFSESTVLSLIYDLYDTNADGPDNISLGLLPLWQALITPNFLQQSSAVSVYSFLDEIDPGASGAAFLNMLSANQIIGQGDWGEGETNDGGIDESLPVYFEIPIGQTKTVCADAGLGSPNNLGNRRLIRLENPTGERIAITAESLVLQDTDPDMALYSQGQCQAFAISSSPDGDETLVTELAGTSVLDLQDWWKLNADLDGAPDQPVPSCFAVSVELAPAEPLSNSCNVGGGSTKTIETRISKPGANVDLQVFENRALQPGVSHDLNMTLTHQYSSGTATITFVPPSGIQLTPQSLRVDLTRGFSIPLVVNVLTTEPGRQYISVDVLIEFNGRSERRALAVPIEAESNFPTEQKTEPSEQRFKGSPVHLLSAEEELIH